MGDFCQVSPNFFSCYLRIDGTLAVGLGEVSEDAGATAGTLGGKRARGKICVGINGRTENFNRGK